MIRIVTNEAEFFGLGNEWDALFARSDNRSYFDTFSSAVTLWQAIDRKRSSLCIIMEYQADMLVTIAPCVIHRSGIWNILKPLGSDLAYTTDIIVTSNSDQNVIWTAMQRVGCSVVRFELLRQDSNWWRTVANWAKIGNTPPDDETPVLDMTPWNSFDDYVAARPASPLRAQTRWSSIRSAVKVLKRQGNLAFNIYYDETMIDEILAWMMTHKEMWLKERAIDMYQNWSEITRARAYGAAKTDNLMLCELTVNGERIAACINFISQKKCLDFNMLAVNYEWRTGSPGKVIFHDLVKWAFDNGYTFFDAGTGAGAYKFLYMNTGVPVHRHLSIPLHIRGKSYIMARSTFRSGADMIRRLKSQKQALASA